MLKQFTKQEKSWMMYDWANSAHSIVVVTVLPIFFMSLHQDKTFGQQQLGLYTSLAAIAIALLAPLLGALGDFKNMKKRLFILFVSIGVMSCLFIAATPFMPIWQLVIGLYALSNFAFAGANIFYDGFLPEITTNERMDKVSSWGFGLGYIGGSTIPFVIFLVLYKLIPVNLAMAISFALTGVWWGVFTIPMIKNVKQTHYIEKKKGIVKDAFIQIVKTLKELSKKKEMLFFLIAYFFYIDGVNTIIHMSTAYGSALNIDATQMMLALLMVQVLAFPFAILYGTLAKKFTAQKMIVVGIGIYMGITVVGFFVSKNWHFWVVAGLVATSQGGIQALSRSMFGKMIPDRKRSNEFFGFFEIFGKFSAIMGPWLFGTVGVLAAKIIKNNNPEIGQQALDKAASPFGVLSVLVIFIIGAIFYAIFLKADKNKKVELTEE